MESFFDLTPSEARPAGQGSLLPSCGLCKLHKSCNTPKMPVGGLGRRNILVIGNHPRLTDDQMGKHFAGDSGSFLRNTLSGKGIKLSRDAWITNSFICYPSNTKADPGQRARWCRPNLDQTIEELKPEKILLLGSTAISSFMSVLLEKGVMPSAYHGWEIPCQKYNAWLYAAEDPSIIRDCRNESVSRTWRHYVSNAFTERSGRPFSPSPPNYTEQVKVLFEPLVAARRLREYIRRGGPVAFDYETNGLKPDDSDRYALTASVCWRGKETIAYPLTGEAKEATRELLRSPLPKIASNMKFEERWTRKIFKTRVANWRWDTMQAAHVLDNREGITSIKFQAFVRLGFGNYNHDVQSFLESPEGNTTNNIHKADRTKLLLYNGLDSLLEYLVAVKQIREFGHKPSEVLR